MNKKLQRIFDRYDDMQHHIGICEPSHNDKPAITANWNNIPQDVFNYLERKGFSCEWEDEWIECDSCCRIFRCSPDSYGWQIYGHVFDGYALCGDCMDWDTLFSESENNPNRAITTSLLYKHKSEIESCYTLVKGEYESGLHPHQTDNPKVILARLLESDPEGKYLFVMTGQGQFEIEFSIYKRKDETS